MPSPGFLHSWDAVYCSGRKTRHCLEQYFESHSSTGLIWGWWGGGFAREEVTRYDPVTREPQEEERGWSDANIHQVVRQGDHSI